MYKRIFGIILIFFVIFFVGCSDKHFLTIKGKRLYIEISMLPVERAKGLSKREKLPQDHGMLFVYNNERILYYWMKDTSIPLSIAFIRKNGVVIGIYDMKPFSLDTVSSIYPCMYALEVNKGWFKDAGLEIGDYIAIPSYDILIKWHDEQNK